MTEAEQWRPIPDSPGYDVSDQGQVRSWRPWHGTPVPRLLKPMPDGRGYRQVSLAVNGRQVNAPIAKLVLLAFVGPRPEGLEARHLDGNPLNNARTNLAYGTHAENEHDKVSHGTGNPGKTHCPQGHAYDAENTYYPSRGGRECRACQLERVRKRHAARRLV